MLLNGLYKRCTVWMELQGSCSGQCSANRRMTIPSVGMMHDFVVTGVGKRCPCVLMSIRNSSASRAQARNGQCHRVTHGMSLQESVVSDRGRRRGLRGGAEAAADQQGSCTGVAEAASPIGALVAEHFKGLLIGGIAGHSLWSVVERRHFTVDSSIG